jgi:hypothetical protein
VTQQPTEDELPHLTEDDYVAHQSTENEIPHSTGEEASDDGVSSKPLLAIHHTPLPDTDPDQEAWEWPLLVHR